MILGDIGNGWIEFSLINKLFNPPLCILLTNTKAGKADLHHRRPGLVAQDTPVPCEHLLDTCEG